MTQIFSEAGESIPVSVIEAGPMFVTQIKTVETDGYNSIQLGYYDLKESRANKPTKGHFAKAGVSLKKFLTEVRVDNPADFQLNQTFTVADFEEGKKS